MSRKAKVFVVFLVENDNLTKYFAKEIHQEIISEIFHLFSFLKDKNKELSFNISLSPSYYLHKEQLSGFVGSSWRSL
jgi:hypothetical protein